MARKRIPYRLEYAKAALERIGGKVHYALIHEKARHLGDKLPARPSYKQHISYYSYLRYYERHFQDEGMGFFSLIKK